MSEVANDIRARERLAGLLLIGGASLALAAANSPLEPIYHPLLEFPIGPTLPRAGALTLHLWVADGLMAIFFLLVGLEVKREWYQGRLSSAAERRLPILAAAAGMAVPALIYLAVVGVGSDLARGWAIPAATDIAFAIGVLALLGEHAPPSIKLLLVTVAIIDDIGAVAIIALAYTSSLDPVALGIAGLITATMAAMGMFGVRRLSPFLIGFVCLWAATFASGVHPTISGVVAALTIPLGQGEARSPLKRLEHRIHPWVMLGIIPLFGFVSAGVGLTGGLGAITEPLPLAIIFGLVAGKQVGVFGAIWLAVRSGLAPMPACTSWPQIHGAALLCGIGFTMSLFIGALAFPGDPASIDSAKLGTLVGSLIAALAGYAALRFASSVTPTDEDRVVARDLFSASEK